VSTTPVSGDSGTAPAIAERMGFGPGLVVQEIGWDSDADDDFRTTVEDAGLPA
jgi:hypothetical protein